MNQQTKTPLNGRIGLGTRMAYGSGDVACNIVYGMISTLLVMFYTDYAGVSPILVGSVMLISRIFDGFSDVVMGYIVSRTNTRWGQSRPWILWMALPYSLGAVLLFTIPRSTELVQFVYMLVTYNFCTTVCYTAINLPYGSLSAMMTRDSRERDMLSVFRMGMSPFGRIIAVTFTLPLVKLFGNDQAAWIKCMSLWAVLALILLVVCFTFCKETVHIAAREAQGSVSLGKNLKALGNNRYFWAVLLLWTFQGTTQTIVGTILPYYCKYIYHNDSWMYSTLYLVETLVIIGVTFLCPLLRSRFTKSRIILFGAIIVLVGQGLFLLNPSSFRWCMFTTVLRGIGQAPLSAFIFGMIGDVVEYGQWKTHLRQESFIFSGGSVGAKVGMGAAQAAITGIMSVCGYIASTGASVEQPQSVLTAIIGIYALAPIFVWILVLIVISLYRLDRKYPDIMLELRAREAHGEL